MAYIRIFPRYNVLKIPCSVNFTGHETANLKVKNVSMGGVQLYSENRIDIDEEFEAQVSFLDKNMFEIKIQKVWSEYIEEEERYRTGFKIKFNNQVEFDSWKKLMMALHMLKSKKEQNGGN